MPGMQYDPAQQQQQQQQQHPAYFDPYATHAQYDLPQFTPELTVPGWTAAAEQQPNFAPAGPMQSHFNHFGNHPVFDPNNLGYPFPTTFDPANGAMPGMPGVPGADQFMQQQDYWDMDAGDFGQGLTQMQHDELMQSLETDGMEDIQSMITNTLAAITPKAPQNPTF